MSRDKILGPEWGKFEGLTLAQMEQLLKEEGGGEIETPAPKQTQKADALETAAAMKHSTVAPLGAEFVGRREAAKSTAVRAINGQGQDWNQYDADVSQVMTNATPEQQVDPRVWAEAWYYVWGLHNRPGTQTNEQTEPQDSRRVTEREEVVAGSMTTERGAAPVPNENKNSKYRIDDPIERQTRRHFEKLLGPFDDQEWYELQNNDINTLEEYEELQARINAKRK